LAEVKELVSQWKEELPRKVSTSIRFSRSSRSQGRLSITAPIQKDLTFSVKRDILFCKALDHKISLDLSDFLIQTEVDGKSVILVFEMKHAQTLRPLAKALDSVADTKYPVFFSRTLNALSGIARELSPEGIEELTAAPSDYQMLVDALSASSVMQEFGKTDPLLRAKLRGLEQRKLVLDRMGGPMNVGDVAKLLNITRQGVDKRRSQNQLIGLTQGRRGYAYPTFQFEDGKTVAGLEEVLGALKGHDPWMQLLFFANGNYRLNGRTPFEELKKGRLEPVLHAAQMYGEQGAA
jgi:hypothetical protein